RPSTANSGRNGLRLYRSSRGGLGFANRFRHRNGRFGLTGRRWELLKQLVYAGQLEYGSCLRGDSPQLHSPIPPPPFFPSSPLPRDFFHPPQHHPNTRQILFLHARKFHNPAVFFTSQFLFQPPPQFSCFSYAEALR